MRQVAGYKPASWQVAGYLALAGIQLIEMHVV